ncbi:unnamed protein product [Closterium sp. NIES-54]
MGGSRMDHGRTSDVHDHADAALSNPILLWRGRKREGLADALCTTEGSQRGRGKLSASVRVQTQNRKVRTKTLSELETSCADPVDQHLGDVTLAAQGEDRGVTRVVVNHQQEVTLAPALLTSAVAGTENVGAGTSTPTSLTPSVPLTKLLGGRGLTTALLLRALTATGATPLRRAATSSIAASAASATFAASATSAPAATATASSASTAAADTSTPATTPTTTPTPTTATTTTSTAPSSPTSAPAPFAPAGAASPARGRRSSDRLETTEVGRSSRSNRGQEGRGGTPLKDWGARVTTRGSYSDYARLCC